VINLPICTYFVNSSAESISAAFLANGHFKSNHSRYPLTLRLILAQNTGSMWLHIGLTFGLSNLKLFWARSLTDNYAMRLCTGYQCIYFPDRGARTRTLVISTFHRLRNVHAIISVFVVVTVFVRGAGSRLGLACPPITIRIRRSWTL